MVKRNINIKQVAQAAGVSAMTVSRYYNQPEKLSSEALSRVEAAIKQLNYVPNNAARTLLRGNSDTLAFIGHFAHHFDYSIFRGIEDHVYEYNYLLFLCNTDSARRIEGRFISGLIQQRVDGVIINPRYSRENLMLLNKHNIPTVVVDPKIPDMPFDVVRGHSFDAGYRLTHALIEQGFKRIVFVGGPKGVTSLDDRLGGYKTAMDEKKLKPVIHLGEYSRESGYNLTMNLFSSNRKKIDMLIAANGLVAKGIFEAFKALRAQQQVVDVRVAAFDATEDFFQREPLLVFNMIQPAYELGLCAAQMLLQRIQGYEGPPRDKVLPFKLVSNS